VSHIGPHDIWRLALDLRPADGEPVEMNAYLTSGGRSLSEIWSYQWRQDDGKVS
jgi:glucan biosynthesis protein